MPGYLHSVCSVRGSIASLLLHHSISTSLEPSLRGGQIGICEISRGFLFSLKLDEKFVANVTTGGRRRGTKPFQEGQNNFGGGGGQNAF